MLVRVEVPDILTDCRGISRYAFRQTTTVFFPAFYFFATREHISTSSDAERRDKVVTRSFPQSIAMVLPSRIRPLLSILEPTELETA